MTKKKHILITLGIRGNFLKLIKSILQNPTENKYNGEIMNLFLLRWVTKQVCPLLSLLFSIALEILHCKSRKWNNRNKDLEGSNKTVIEVYFLISFTYWSFFYSLEAHRPKLSTPPRPPPTLCDSLGPLPSLGISHLICEMKGWTQLS